MPRRQLRQPVAFAGSCSLYFAFHSSPFARLPLRLHLGELGLLPLPRRRARMRSRSLSCGLDVLVLRARVLRGGPRGRPPRESTDAASQPRRHGVERLARATASGLQAFELGDPAALLVQRPATATSNSLMSRWNRCGVVLPVIRSFRDALELGASEKVEEILRHQRVLRTNQKRRRNSVRSLLRQLANDAEFSRCRAPSLVRRMSSSCTMISGLSSYRARVMWFASR